jgi:ribonuclease BN (tRNA processing enzyme)
VRLTVVGCAGSFPSPDSATSCYLVEADDETGRRWRVLLDLGNGALGPLQTYLGEGVGLADLDAVLLSHLHPDHCLDLCGLYVALTYDPTGTPGFRLPVYGPSHTFDRLERAYGEHERGSLAKAYDVRSWIEGEPVRLGPFTITPRRVEHPVEAYGLRVACDGAVLAYSGDTDACDALVDLARDAGLLLCEASFVEGRDDARGVHLTGRRAGQVAAAAGASRLVLTHIPIWTDPAVVGAEARELFDGPIEIAKPGLRFDLG